MKLNISRVPTIAEHGDESNAMMNLSLQAGRQLAQTLQCLGIRSIRLSASETMGGVSLEMDEVHFFEGVPDVVFKWAHNVLRPVCGFMSGFGIQEIALDPEGGDADSLRDMWRRLESDRSQMRRQQVPGPDVAPSNGGANGSSEPGEETFV